MVFSNFRPTEACACVLLLALFPAGQMMGQSTAAQQQDSLQTLLDAAQRAQTSGNMVTAEQAYKNFLTQAETDLGQAFALAGDTARTDTLFDQAIRLSQDPALKLNAARASLLNNELTRAATLATEVITSGPKDNGVLAGAHQALGSILLKQKNDREARKHFEIATALDPTFQNGYDLAVACLNLGDETCAVKLFQEMRTSFKDTAELHVAFGKAYGNSDFQQRAVDEFRMAIAINPHLPGTHYLLAAVLLAGGGDESARTSAEKELNAELAISPHDPLTFAALGQIALVRRNIDLAIDLLRKSVIYGPSLPEGYLYLGQAYFDSGQLGLAEAALRNCIRLTRDESRNRYQVQKAHYLLGRILAQQNKPDEAHAELSISRELANKALALDKTRLAGLMTSAHPTQLDVQLSEVEDAGTPVTRHDDKALRQAQELESKLRPALADSFNNLGAIVAGHNDYADAAADFHEAAQWNPDLPGIDYNWGRAAFAANLYPEAIPPLTRYVAAHPDDQGAHNVLAISQFRVGDFQGCLKAFERTNIDDTQDPQIRYIYAVSLVKTGQAENGLLRLRALARQFPTVTEIQSSLAEAEKSVAK